MIGEVGELVVTEPMPSMPVFFWGDEDGSRYRASYFEQYPGVWRHGDWIEITERGTAIIYGRSDSTINRSGVRMGTQRDLSCAVLSVDAILDALVVDIPRPGTEGAGCRSSSSSARGPSSTRTCARRSPAACASECSPRHVPERGLRDRRGPPHPQRQGPRGAGQAAS